MSDKARRVVVKVGTSSLTNDANAIDGEALARLCRQIDGVRGSGTEVVLVSSAAISAGMFTLAMTERPRDFASLQALSAVGQIELMRHYEQACRELGFHCGQVLLAPPDFFARGRYLRARSCIEQQLAFGVLPIVNENDAVADDAIRFGDNDRIAALVAHLVQADLLVLLTDTDGLLTADPRLDPTAELIEEIDAVEAVDSAIEQRAGGATSSMSQGGMASKLAAAKIAAWSGVTTVIAAAHRPDVLIDAVQNLTGVGTLVRARSERMGARKLWLAFALEPEGRIVVDDGARRALLDSGSSLLAVGATAVEGDFLAGAPVEVTGVDRIAFARGLAGENADALRSAIGKREFEMIHRDDFAMLPVESR